MKEGYVLKSFDKNQNYENELSLINNYSRSKLSADDVYVFSVVLCDNDIDRDFECFSLNSLYKLADLFIGKTGIMDHDAKSENQNSAASQIQNRNDRSKTIKGGFASPGPQF